MGKYIFACLTLMEQEPATTEEGAKGVLQTP
jgi:hypothetical protein